MVSFYLVDSRVEVDFLAVLFGFAFLLVVVYLRDIFVSGRKFEKNRKVMNERIKFIFLKIVSS